MPWKERSVSEQRFGFVADDNSEQDNLAELCESYGVTRKTGYKWLARYRQAGLEGLRDRRRAPHHQPNQLSDKLEERILELRQQDPRWGAPKLRGLLMRAGSPVIPAESTIGALLNRHGLTVARRHRRPSRAAGETQLTEAKGPNWVWCIDFKGWFLTVDGDRIDPLTISDQYSRYLFRCQVVRRADTVHTKLVMEAAFREYGLPERIRSDNGALFGSNGESGLTALTVWWIKLGIVPEHLQPGKPQQNGRHERMHRTLKQETASPPAANRRAQQARFDRFRKEYNEQRPQQALGQKPPAEFYRPSLRVYPLRLQELEYPAGWKRRRISAAGQMKWLSQDIFVSHALQAETVGLEQIDDRHWRVWFGTYQVGVLDDEKRTLRRPTRPQPPDEESESA